MRLSGVEGGTYGIEALDSREGLRRLELAALSLEKQCPATPNPLFEKLTHDEWKRLQLRDAELYLSFFDPRGRYAPPSSAQKLPQSPQTAPKDAAYPLTPTTASPQHPEKGSTIKAEIV